MDMIPPTGGGDNDVLHTVLLLTLVGAVGSATRFMIIPRQQHVMAYLRSLFLGGVGCILAFIVCREFAVGLYGSLAASGVVAAVADDLLRGFFLLMFRWRENPDGLLAKFIGRKEP